MTNLNSSTIETNTYIDKQYGIETQTDAVDEILLGLNASQKYISSKYFYDTIGSELFEEITKLDEYYPTRTEKQLIGSISTQLPIKFENLNIIELGSGDHSKIDILLNQIPKETIASCTYTPIDISESALNKSASYLAKKYPYLSIQPIIADFISQLNRIPKGNKKLICFFGSTIGNLTMKESEQFMKILGNQLSPQDHLIMGMDMIKKPSTIEIAYNDKKEITAAFNKNILNVINSKTGANFSTEYFEHLAFYNESKCRIEMHLVAKYNHKIYFSNNHPPITIKKGETIHTENSHKFDKPQMIQYGKWGGLSVSSVITDSNKWFSLVHYKKE